MSTVLCMPTSQRRRLATFTTASALRAEHTRATKNAAESFLVHLDCLSRLLFGTDSAVAPQRWSGADSLVHGPRRRLEGMEDRSGVTLDYGTWPESGSGL